MTLFEILSLAVVQGLTEFLPVSSSGHLVLAGSLFGTLPEENLPTIIALHVATACAALLFYRRDIADLVRGLVAREKGALRLLLLIAGATVATAVIGLTFRGLLAGLFSSTRVVAASLFATGAILISASLRSPGGETMEEMAWWKALLIGLAQGIAIVPGLSRSGTTIAVALFLGLRRTEAVKFSFLLLIPATAGATLLESLQTASLGGGNLLQLAAGFLVAALVGYASILLVLRWTGSGRLWYFGVYCWSVAALAALAG
jgi:undecaprenyl-diphosphatase